jgi:hypothetical protein
MDKSDRKKPSRQEKELMANKKDSDSKGLSRRQFSPSSSSSSSGNATKLMTSKSNLSKSKQKKKKDKAPTPEADDYGMPAGGLGGAAFYGAAPQFANKAEISQQQVAFDYAKPVAPRATSVPVSAAPAPQQSKQQPQLQSSSASSSSAKALPQFANLSQTQRESLVARLRAMKEKKRAPVS